MSKDLQFRVMDMIDYKFNEKNSIEELQKHIDKTNFTHC